MRSEKGQFKTIKNVKEISAELVRYKETKKEKKVSKYLLHSMSILYIRRA